MKRGSTLFLRAAILAIILAVLAICIFVLPLGIREGNEIFRPVLWGLYVPAIPFFVAIYQAMKLLSFIDNNQAFSGVSIRALKNIRNCAVIISGMFIVGMPYIFYAADKDDAPGAIVIGLIIIFASFIIATFSAVLQRLLQDAITIKSENDLTV